MCFFKFLFELIQRTKIFGNGIGQGSFGRTAFSWAHDAPKEGMIPVDTLGVLYLSTKDGVEFGCGSGFDDATRKEL